jgi:ACT domain-containing protein
MILYVANGTIVVEGRRRLTLSLYQKYDVNSKIAKTISMTMSIDEIKSVTIVGRNAM